MFLLYCAKKDGQAFTDEFSTAAGALDFARHYWQAATESTRRGIRVFAVVEAEERDGCLAGAPLAVWKGGAK